MGWIRTRIRNSKNSQLDPGPEQIIPDSQHCIFLFIMDYLHRVQSCFTIQQISFTVYMSNLKFKMYLQSVLQDCFFLLFEVRTDSSGKAGISLSEFQISAKVIKRDMITCIIYIHKCIIKNAKNTSLILKLMETMQRKIFCQIATVRQLL